MPTFSANIISNDDDILMEVIAQTNDRERINRHVNEKKAILADYKINLEKLLKEVPELEKSIVFIREKGLMLVNSINHFYAELTDKGEADVDSAGAYFLHTTRREIKRYIDNTTIAIARKKRQIEEYETVNRELENTIKNLTRQLLTLKNTTGHVFSNKHLTERLAPFGVTGVAFATKRNSPYITLFFDAMKATVNGTQFDNTPQIEIPATRVLIYLDTRKVFVISEDEEEGYVYFSDNTTPHPHIMNNDAPCLGDYDSPVNESIENYDIETVAMLIKEYLSNVNHQDAAGRTWTRFYGHRSILENLETDETITCYVPCSIHLAGDSFTIRALHEFRKELILDVNENGELYFNEDKFFWYNEEYTRRIDQDEEIITSPDHPSFAEYFVSDIHPNLWDNTEIARFEEWVQRERMPSTHQTAMDEAAQELETGAFA